MKGKAFIFIIVFILCNSAVISSQARDNSLNSQSFTYNSNNVSFSSKSDYTSSTINLYSIYNDLNNFYISNITGFMVNDAYGIRPESSIPISSIVKNYSQIMDKNYFVSNNNKFISLSSYYNDTYSVIIKNLQTNQTFLSQGQSSYKIALISSFTNSSDIYVSFYNETMFNIVKYSFQYNNFSIYLQTKNFPHNDYFLSNVNVFFLNNEIYSSLVITDNTSTTLSYDSRVIILSTNVLKAFNKTFSNIRIDFITPTGLGFFFHSPQNSFFYDYRFSSDTYKSVPAVFPGVMKLMPFDNKTFIVFNSQILICTLDVSQSTGVIYINQTYNLRYNTFNQELFTYNLASGNYYFFGTASLNNQYIGSINNMYEGPVDIVAISTTTTSITPSSSYSSQSQYYSTQQSTIVSTSDNFIGLLLIILIFVFGFIGITVYTNRERNRDQQYQSRDSSFSNVNNYQNQTIAPKQQIFIKNNFCVECGSSIEPDDVFCQNCGRRI